MKSEHIIEYDSKAVIFFLIPPIPSPGFSRHLRMYTDRFILNNNRNFVGQAFIAVNRKCPFNCWYCSSYDTPDNELVLNEIDEIIKLLMSWGASTIVFTGGEPLLRSDIDQMISKYANELTFVILTSGYGLDNRRAKKLKEAGLFAVSISLDHYEKEMNDKSRGVPGAFEISLEAVKNAKQMGLYTVVQTVVSRELIDGDNLWHFVDFISKLGADELFLLEPLCTGRLFNNPNSNLLSEKEIEKLKLFHSRGCNANMTKVTVSSHIEDPLKYGCGAGIEHIYIDTTGNLWPCNFLPVSLGNILKEPEIVKNRLFKYFGKPCSHCLLKEYRSEFLKFYRGKLPIRFELVENIFEQRANTNHGVPGFFRLKGVIH